MHDTSLRAASILARSVSCGVLTGAGISVESGIPAFHGYQGLWEKYDPIEFAHISAFRRDPEKVWEMLADMWGLLLLAEPNPAHIALAKLEKRGIVSRVITQNIDGLHQRAGSEGVIEYHGNAWTLLCLDCRKIYKTAEKAKRGALPLCTCGSVLKPDVVFYGEQIPREPALSALNVAREADLFMVVGTSGTVAPANELPFIALERKVPVIIINPERSDLVDYPGTLWIEGGAAAALTEIIDILEGKRDID
jgi:NAD-dependent deacetylase